MMESGKGGAAVFFDLKHLTLHPTKRKTASHWPGPCAMDYQLPHKPYMQYVVVIGVASKSLHVISCVPQGSVLGPLLFLIYTNAIAELPLSPESQLVMYADNILLYRPIRQAPAYQLLQQDVEALGEWANNNILHLILQNRKPWYFQEMTNKLLKTFKHLFVECV